jgi:hypothetical protein
VLSLNSFEIMVMLVFAVFASAYASFAVNSAVFAKAKAALAVSSAF